MADFVSAGTLRIRRGGRRTRLSTVEIDLGETDVDGFELRRRERGGGFAVRFDIQGTVHDIDADTITDAFSAHELHPVELELYIEEGDD